TAREITTVALAAHANARLAGQHRADRYRVNPDQLDLIDRILVDQRPRPHNDLATDGIGNVDSRSAAQNAVGKRGDHLATVHNRARRQAADGSAVLLGDDGVLSDVDEPAGKIARISSL